MFFQLYLKNLPSYKEEIQDRLSRDNSNHSLKDFLLLVQTILKDYYSFTLESIPSIETFVKNVESMNVEEIADFTRQQPELKEQLDFYLHNRAQITLLRTYIESSAKVKNVARDFFKKDNSDK
jgi:hypothetical protein